MPKEMWSSYNYRCITAYLSASFLFVLETKHGLYYGLVFRVQVIDSLSGWYGSFFFWGGAHFLC